MIDLAQIVRALRPTLRVQTVAGEPITIGEREIVPVARSVYLAIGYRGGPLAAGWVWNWPVAVLETWRGRTRRIAIPNLTRRITWGLLASGLALALAARYLPGRQKKLVRSVER